MFIFWTFFCDLQVFWNVYDFFFKTHFFYEFQIELKQWVFLQSIWFFVLVKADISYFTMIKFIAQSHHIPRSYLGFKCAFFQNILFFTKKWKKGAFKLNFGRMTKWTSYSKERPIFDLGLSWFVFVTLETSCINNISKKNSRALECYT